MAKRKQSRYVGNLMEGTRVYLSGPMDFVASRAQEMKYGWRSRVGAFLRSMGCIVFDPWQKPEVRGLHEYGREGVDTDKIRDQWTFENTAAGAGKRSGITGKFWETLHIDLRMVDTSDFTIAYCPTNIYSVGTSHEIALCRLQRKPVLLVSPPVEFPTLEALRRHLSGDSEGLRLLDAVAKELPIKSNPRGVPSLWYMPLVGGEHFFDGFGFATYAARFGWQEHPLDERERAHPPARPLLPFLARLRHELPKKWDGRSRTFVRNDDWLLWDLRRKDKGGETTHRKKEVK